MDHVREPIIDYALTTPIYTTTSYLQKSSSCLSNETTYSYARSEGPNFTTIKDKIQKLYGTKSTSLCPSGMNAISSVLNALLNYDDYTLILADIELYCDSRTLLEGLTKRPNLKLKFVDFTDLKQIHAHWEQDQAYKTRYLFCESCSNPSGRMFDLLSLSALYNDDNDNKLDCNYKGCLIVDNSWS